MDLSLSYTDDDLNTTAVVEPELPVFVDAALFATIGSPDFSKTNRVTPRNVPPHSPLDIVR